MPGPAMDAVQSACSRSRHAEQREFGGQPFRGPALCKELSPCGSQVPCHSNQPQTPCPPGNEHNGAPGSKGFNLHISWNNHSPGRNDGLEDKTP